MALTLQDDKENQSLKKLPICPPNTTRIIPLEQVYPDRRVLIKSSGDFESLNPYNVNDDRREYFSVLKDPEFSFEEYLEMQRMMNQFVTRKILSDDKLLKKCEKTYDAFKASWKTSGLLGHYVSFANPASLKKNLEVNSGTYIGPDVQISFPTFRIFHEELI